VAGLVARQPYRSVRSRRTVPRSGRVMAQQEQLFALQPDQLIARQEHLIVL
jgi:hypothetical protein